MSDNLLRIILRVSVIAVMVLLVAMWRVFRSDNKWAKIAIVGVLAGIGFIFALNEFGLKIKGKFTGPDPAYFQKLESVAEHVAQNKTQIDQLAEKLESLRALVVRDDWLPGGELASERSDELSWLVWAYQLRDEESPGFDDSYDDLWELEEIVCWAADPRTIAETYDDQPLERLSQLLDKTAGPLALVAQIESIQLPEITDVQFSPEGKVSSKFTPGTCNFSVAVVELKTGTVLAYGHGQAANRDSVHITADSLALENDLWLQTKTAAQELGQRLLQKSE